MVQLPRPLARFNKRVTNRIQGTWAWLLPPWAVIVHRGRRSGQEYQTPVLAFVTHGRLVVLPLYGVESDWVRNALAAGHAEVRRLGRRRPLVAPRLVRTSDRATLGWTSVLARRLADQAFVADLG